MAWHPTLRICICERGRASGRASCEKLRHDGVTVRRGAVRGRRGYVPGTYSAAEGSFPKVGRIRSTAASTDTMIIMAVVATAMMMGVWYAVSW